MTILKLLSTAVLLLTLVACKPPKFDQEINCPLANFHARGVAVYEYEQGYAIVYPDKRMAQVSHEGCVVTSAP